MPVATASAPTMPAAAIPRIVPARLIAPSVPAETIFQEFNIRAVRASALPVSLDTVSAAASDQERHMPGSELRKHGCNRCAADIREHLRPVASLSTLLDVQFTFALTAKAGGEEGEDKDQQNRPEDRRTSRNRQCKSRDKSAGSSAPIDSAQQPSRQREHR